MCYWIAYNLGGAQVTPGVQAHHEGGLAGVPEVESQGQGRKDEFLAVVSGVLVVSVNDPQFFVIAVGLEIQPGELGTTHVHHEERGGATALPVDIFKETVWQRVGDDMIDQVRQALWVVEVSSEQRAVVVIKIEQWARQDFPDR